MQWHRMDLHVHTPGSRDFQDQDASYIDVLHKIESENLDIMAFTDHNTVAGYAAMKREIQDLERFEELGRIRPEEKKTLEEYHRLLDKILVLPGFEFTATFGFHILAIFDEDTTVRELEHVLLELGVPVESLDRGETEVGATTDVLTAYEIMADAGALVIGAHANSSHGVAMMHVGFGGQTRIAYTQDPNLHALEVTDLESKRRRTTATFFNGSKPEYPRRMHCIQGSDAHALKGEGKHPGIGERATEVLLPERSFTALKELFLSTDFGRTRPYRRSEQPFDHVQAARKQGPSIVQSFHEGMTRRGGRLHAVLRDVVAYANTNGGTIYVGISPNPKVPLKGLDATEEDGKTLQEEIDRLVTPPINVDITELESEGKKVLRVVVPKGEDPPYVLEGSNIYLRQEDETSLAMRDEIVALIRRALIAKEELVPAAAAPATSEAVADPTATARPKVQAERPQQRPAPRRQRQPRAPQQDQAVKQAAPEPATVSEGVRPEPSVATVVAERPSGNGIERPRTGVEIVDSEERKGVLYHTMCDLRDGGLVHNVSRSSARRLWRYAIALEEKGTFEERKVDWHGNLGLWHKYLRSGRPHYDLVQRTPDGEIHVYYGVTEDGIHGPWKAIVGDED
jgi:hypothetical protein